MTSITDPKTEALIATLPPRIREEARAAQKAVVRDKQEAASRAVLTEIETMSPAEESGIDAVERMLSAAPAAPSAAEPATITRDAAADAALLAECDVLGHVVADGAADADLLAEASRLGGSEGAVA